MEMVHDRCSTLLTEFVHDIRNKGNNKITEEKVKTHKYNKISQQPENCENRKMYKDKEVNKNVKNIFLSMCNVKVFLTFTFVVKILLGKSIVYYRLCRDAIYIDKILVSEYKLFKRSNKANLLSRNLWVVMKAGGMAF
jgi:hypothetical protein